jgi:tetratricopeptide (TPR) repeat protein
MRRRLPRPNLGWASAALVAAGAAAYANSLAGPFVCDDLQSIPDNPTIRHLWPILRLLHPPGGGTTVDGRPVLNVSLALNYALSGNAVWSYHLTNLLIHVLAAAVLFGLVRRTADRLARWGAQPAGGTVQGVAGDGARRGGLCSGGEGAALALAIALLWELHPLQTESVTYMIQRAESLMGLFYLLTLYGAVRAAESEGRATLGWRLVSWLACLLGMGTKEVMVSAPVIVLAYEGFFIAGSWRAALRQRPGYYLALAATWIPLAVLVMHSGLRGGSTGPDAEATYVGYWLTQPGAIARYLRLAFWPTGQVFNYGAVWVKSAASVIPAGCLVLGLAGATAWGWRQRRRAGGALVGFLGLWFFAVLAPTSFVPGSAQTVTEHRMYLPLIPVLAAAAWGLVRLGRRLRLWGPAAVALLGFALALPCAWATHRRNRDYVSWIALYGRDVERQPESPFAQTGLGIAYGRAGRFAEAVPHLEAAIRLKPGWGVPEYALGLVMEQTLRPAEAEPHLRRAILGYPEEYAYREALFICLILQGRKDEAMAGLVPWVRSRPRAAANLEAMAREWTLKAQTAEGIALSEALVRALPDEPILRSDLGVALAKAGRWPEAAECYREALRRNPADAATHFNLAAALIAEQRTAEAVDEYRAALRFRPDFPSAHCNLGDALLELGRKPEAIAEYEAAVRLDPALDHPREMLARLRVSMEP